MEYAKILNTESVIVYGLRATLVTYEENYYRYTSPDVLYLEESLRNLYNRTGIDSFERLTDNEGIKDPSRRELNRVQGALIPLPVDVEWYNDISKKWSKMPKWEDFPGTEHFSNVCNWIGNQNTMNCILYAIEEAGLKGVEIITT